MPTDWFEKLAHLAQSAGTRLVVRSALNPLLWLCAIFCPPCWATAVLLRTDVFALRFLLVLGAVPVVTTCGAAVYFAVRQPERLQSEDYQIRRQTLQMPREKGRRAMPDAELLARIMKPSERPPNPRGDK